MHSFVFSDGPTGIAVVTGMRMMFFVSIIALIGLTERILLGLAAYNDARSKSNSDAAMWGLLIGFLGLIPGIIYLCIRNSARGYTVCTNCGFGHPATESNCPKCGAPNLAVSQYSNPFAAQQAHRAKVLFTVALVLVGLTVLLSIVVGMQIATAILYSAGSHFNY